MMIALPPTPARACYCPPGNWVAPSLAWREPGDYRRGDGMRTRRGRALGALVGLALAAFAAQALPVTAAELPTDPKCEFSASPPRPQLHLRAPLHRCAAQPQKRQKTETAGARRLSHLPRQPPLLRRKGQRTKASFRGTLPQAGGRRHRTLEPLPRLGLHRRERR